MFAGFLTPSAVVLHLFLTENAISVDYHFSFLWRQLVHWIGMVGIGAAVLIRVVFLIKGLPSVIGTLGDTETFTGP